MHNSITLGLSSPGWCVYLALSLSMDMTAGESWNLCLHHFLMWKMEKADLPPRVTVRAVVHVKTQQCWQSSIERKSPKVLILDHSLASLWSLGWQEWEFKPQREGGRGLIEESLSDPEQWAGIQGRAPNLEDTWQIGQERMPELPSRGGVQERLLYMERCHLEGTQAPKSQSDILYTSFMGCKTNSKPH
jgi:hypothetical protein